ncbi:SusC/RagA family TonB-linked outer membrane protein [Flavitalea sp. BT771]|uniref:SusC/RagA family TonB-linked outer membrane protein n=1 Tax=Flavitalea sp. BT771 TaxID=3063329 RepID=UPI0026E4489A|nr:SusC/RagA family TonB-linked outer membrane protein [Flavitalea sp. BT771]MDO6429055.1 SusC/RagA family TonB-linked outer membrane protein [Flavitalea sp. BT771]MDV6218817.1 SusC/RagA family TonB-linked outer membrane protein [Flavitalea sp. BT771]
MKLTVIFLVASLQLSARGFGQGITIYEKKAPISKVFEDIRKQTGYTFVYAESILANAKAVSINVHNATLEEALTACFQDQPLTWSIMENAVVVKERSVPSELKAIDTVPARRYAAIRGKVTDSLGKPLRDVSVTVKGLRKGTSTDAEGNFTVPVKDERSVLIFSMIGYRTKNITVGNLRELAVVLTEASADLNDVVVTGYQNQSRRLSGSSTATVDIKSASIQPVASFDQMLQGQASGLNIKTGSGQPGRSSDVVIRGKGSINGSTDPLYIVDGIQLQAKDFQSMNPLDFESVTVLKDGASASLYGSRGANGVIVVTTKKGREGRTAVTYTGQMGFSKLPPSKLKTMNGPQHVDFEMNIAGNPYSWTPAQADSLRKINFDWETALFRSAPMQEHQLSFSGGNNKTKYFSSLSYLDQDGILLNTNLRRYTGRFNIEHTISNFKIGTNIAGGWSKSRNVKEGNESMTPLNTILWALPYEVPYTSSGQYTTSIQGVGNWTNPFEEVNRNMGHTYYTKAYGNGFVEYKFPMVRELTWRSNIGGDYTQSEYFNITNNGTQDAQHDGQATSPMWGQGNLSQGFSKQFRSTITNSLSYKHIFGPEGQHNLNASIYHETIRTQASGFGYQGFGLLNPYPNAAGLVAGTTTNGYIPVINNIVYTPDYGIVSFFGIVDYVYKHKMVLGGSVRRDGSSRLSPDNRWVNYGGISGAYILSEENFLRNHPVISLLKAKASYGTVGNQEGIGDFPYLQQYASGTFGGGSSLAISAFGNKNLKWETRTTFNTGVELGLFKNRITANLEFYNSITNNLFFNLTTPATSGGPGQVLGNAGSMRNRGWEASISLAVIHNSDFDWNISANYSLNRNVVLSLPLGQQSQLYHKYQILQVGKPFNSFYLDRFQGVDPQTGSAIYLKADGKTLTHTYDPNDRVTLGTSDAPFNGGINNGLRYKSVNLSFLWVYSYGNSVYNYARTQVEIPGYSSAGFSTNGLNAWTKPGQITNFPSMNDPFKQNTTRYLEDDKFWRLRNVMLTYNLPQQYCRWLKINSFQLFVQGQNLVTLFKFQAFDPEISTTNSSTANSNADITGAQYPPLRSYSFGATINF